MDIFKIVNEILVITVTMNDLYHLLHQRAHEELPGQLVTEMVKWQSQWDKGQKQLQYTGNVFSKYPL